MHAMIPYMMGMELHGCTRFYHKDAWWGMSHLLHHCCANLVLLQFEAHLYPVLMSGCAWYVIAWLFQMTLKVGQIPPCKPQPHNVGLVQWRIELLNSSQLLLVIPSGMTVELHGYTSLLDQFLGGALLAALSWHLNWYGHWRSASVS